MTVAARKPSETGQTAETADFRDRCLEKIATRAVFGVIRGATKRAQVQRTLENRCFDGRAP